MCAGWRVEAGEGMSDAIDLLEIAEYSWSIDDAVASAAELGFTVVHSSPDRILLDLDDGAAMDRYRQMLPRLTSVFGLKEKERWRSKSGVGTHVVVECDPLPFASRVAIAACLGSDPMREGLAVAMLRDGKDEPSVLFRPKVTR